MFRGSEVLGAEHVRLTFCPFELFSCHNTAPQGILSVERLKNITCTASIGVTRVFALRTTSRKVLIWWLAPILVEWGLVRYAISQHRVGGSPSTERSPVYLHSMAYNFNDRKRQCDNSWPTHHFIGGGPIALALPPQIHFPCMSFLCDTSLVYLCMKSSPEAT